jgi:hypothetical protein
MAITPGSRFDHSEILPPLGAGGMGEVFRARQPRCGRRHRRGRRALSLQNDLAQSRQAMRPSSRLWKDADADLPILIEAKSMNV